RREVVRGTLPLLVDVGMASLTGVRLHEEFAGDLLFPINLRGTGEEITLGSVAFVVHRLRRVGRIMDAQRILPTRIARVITGPRESCQSDSADRITKNCATESRREPATLACPIGKQQSARHQRQDYMKIEPVPFGARCTDLDKSNANPGRYHQQDPAQPRHPRASAEQGE